MLEVLRIKNIAIIDSAEICFKPGLNILSGETGAGKSIVIEAISLLLGSRATTELIRAGCDEAVIEGLFLISNIPWVKQRLEQFGFDGNTPELLIKRTVHRAGRHRISINGELATLSILQNICEGLIDLCGQHEHQSLLKSQTQLELLDRYGGLTEQTRELTNLLKELHEMQQEQLRLIQADQDRAQKSDFLKLQIDEIKNAQIVPNEDEALLKQKQLLQSAKGRVQAAENTRQILESDETGALIALSAALQKLRALNLIDEQVKSLVESLERAIAETEDVAIALNRYVNSVELDPERLADIQERLSLLSDLRRKYGPKGKDILTTLADLEQEYSNLAEVSDRLNEVAEKVQENESEIRKRGTTLSASRHKASEILARKVTDELKDLKMGEAKFMIDLTFKENLSDWNQLGGDTIQFVVQTNRGEPARPLGKIASGGELSRLMLSIRRVIANRGGIGVYLFDEIDSGIGGQTAFQVGKKFKSVASYNQVICITHLPQVASFADHHWVVRKSTHKNRTLTEVVGLTPQERKEELARMLGGPELTHRSMENASELLELADKCG